MLGLIELFRARAAIAHKKTAAAHAAPPAKAAYTHTRGKKEKDDIL